MLNVVEKPFRDVLKENLDEKVSLSLLSGCNDFANISWCRVRMAK